MSYTRATTGGVLTHPEHRLPGVIEPGNQMLLLGFAKNLVEGHWHNTTQPNRRETRAWVSGTAEDCDAAYAAYADDTPLARSRPLPTTIDPYEASLLVEEPDPSVGVHPVVTVTDEALLAGIRAADEAFDPVREGLVEEVVTDIHHTGEPTILARVKPERGGKRVCAYPGCGHSESRHNASGQCRTCTEGPCTGFRVEA